MLPHAQHEPTLLLEECRRVFIARLVRSELGGPPLCVGGRARPVLRAAVPEAAVDEDGYLAPSESDVDGSPRPTWDRVRDAVAQACRMEQSTDLELRVGVTPTKGTHARGDGSAGRAGVGWDRKLLVHPSIVSHLPLQCRRAVARPGVRARRHARHRRAERLAQLEHSF